MKRRNIFVFGAAFALLAMSGVNAMAQVNRVQMHIDGYLCGN
jgi:hypothetical protein